MNSIQHYEDIYENRENLSKVTQVYGKDFDPNKWLQGLRTWSLHSTHRAGIQGCPRQKEASPITWLCLLGKIRKMFIIHVPYNISGCICTLINVLYNNVLFLICQVAYFSSQCHKHSMTNFYFTIMLKITPLQNITNKYYKLEWFDCAQSTGMPPTSRDRPFL